MVLDRRYLDQFMADAWPSAETVRTQGSRFRFTSGVTRRANSALPAPTAAEYDETQTNEFIDRAEAFYAEREVPPTFQLSDAVGERLPPTLVGRGYAPVSETVVLVGAVAELEVPGPADSRSADLYVIEAATEFDDAWFNTYWSVESQRRASDAEAELVRSVLLKPSLPAGFVSAVGSDGQVSAVGQVVVDGTWGCGQCLATAPHARRRGAGGAVLRGLADHAKSMGVDQLVVAVQADNDASLKLCRRAGFSESHRYRYFVPGSG